MPVAVKAEFVRRLLDAGLPLVEATSFVPPPSLGVLSWPTPAELLAELTAVLGEPHAPAAGAGAQRARSRRALAIGQQHVAVFASATETFAQRNLNSTYADHFAMFAL